MKLAKGSVYLFTVLPKVVTWKKNSVLKEFNRSLTSHFILDYYCSNHYTTA